MALQADTILSILTDTNDEIFNEYNQQFLSLNDNQTLITKVRNNSNWSTAYGNKIKDNKKIKQRCWSFRVHKTKFGYINIGIDTNRNSLNGNFLKQFNTNNYGFHAGNGYLFSCGRSKHYGTRLYSNDIITMYLETRTDSNYFELFFEIQDRMTKKLAFDKIPKQPNDAYYVAVSLRNKNDSIELIGFAENTHTDHGASNTTNGDKSKQPEKMDETLQQMMVFAQKKQELQEQILHEKDSIIHELKMKNKSLTARLIQYDNAAKIQKKVIKKQKLRVNELMNGSPIVHDKLAMKEQLMNMESALLSFLQQYKEKNILIDSFQDNPQSLYVESEINSLRNTMYCFDQRLRQVQNDILALIRPISGHYHTWNREEMVDWIKSLDGGRFSRYQSNFLFGFEKAGMHKGGILPDLTKEVLRAYPYKIMNFRDRRDLEKHFQLLRHQNNNVANNGYNGHNGYSYN